MHVEYISRVRSAGSTRLNQPCQVCRKHKVKSAVSELREAYLRKSPSWAAHKNRPQLKTTAMEWDPVRGLAGKTAGGSACFPRFGEASAVAIHSGVNTDKSLSSSRYAD